MRPAMRDRPVATEKIAVFTAVRLEPEFEAGGWLDSEVEVRGWLEPEFEAGGWRSGADKRRAIVRRRRGWSAVSLRHGQHRLSDQAQSAVAARAGREPSVHVGGQDLL